MENSSIYKNFKSYLHSWLNQKQNQAIENKT